MDHSILTVKVIFLLALKLLPPAGQAEQGACPPILTHGVCVTRGRQSLAAAPPRGCCVGKTWPTSGTPHLVTRGGGPREGPGLWLPAKEDKGASPPTSKREGL